jgi:hypothetical protein
MIKVQSVIHFLVGITVLVLLVWGGYELVAFVVNYISLVPKEVTVVLIIGSVVIIWSTIIIAAGQREASKFMYRSKEKKWKGELYEEVTTKCLSLFFMEDGIDKKSMDSTELLDHLAKHEPQIVLRGANKVVRKYTEFKQHLAQTKHIDDTAAQKFMELLLAFRNDLDGGKVILLEINDLRKLLWTDVEYGKGKGE